MEAIKANAWTLQKGDRFASGIFAGCTVVRTEDVRKGETRVYYTRDTDFLHCFDTYHNRPFKIEPVE